MRPAIVPPLRLRICAAGERGLGPQRVDVLTQLKRPQRRDGPLAARIECLVFADPELRQPVEKVRGDLRSHSACNGLKPSLFVLLDLVCRLLLEKKKEELKGHEPVPSWRA